MESTSDKIRAVVYAVLVHVLCIALALSGMFWWQSNKAVQAAGQPIEAVFVDLGSLQPVAPPPSPPRPTPPPPTPPQPPATDLAAEDEREQQRIDELAQLRADEEAREQEELRQRAEQILLEEEEERRREEQREREQQQQREREQAQREAAERAEAEREAAEREAAEAAEQAQPQPGSGGEDTGLQAQYASAIQRLVTSHWRRPETTPRGVVCRIRIIQIPGGEVLSANVTSPCNADELTRRSIEAAVLRAQPLPYNGFESVFQREITFTFQYQTQ